MNLSWRWIVLWRLLALLKPFLGWMLLSVVLGVGTIAAGISLFGSSAYLIAYAALQPSVAALQIAIVGVRFFGISRAVFRYLERLVSHSVNFQHLAGLRVWFYRQIEPLAPAVLQDYKAGDLLNIALADIEALEEFYVRAVAPPLSALVIATAIAIFTWRYDFRIALILIGSLILGGICLPMLAYRLGRIPGKAVVKHRANLNGFLLDAIQGMHDLLAFGQCDRQINQIRLERKSLNWAAWRVGLSGSLANALIQVLTGIVLLGILLIAIPQVGGRINSVTLAVLTLVTMASFEAITPLIPAGLHLERSLQSARRLLTLVERPPIVNSLPQPLPAPKSANICIHGLTFMYPGETQIALNKINLEIPFGKHIALLGPSGVGKTSLINLILRFWEFQQGSIELDGHDIRKYDPNDVRRLITFISHPGYLFSDTLRQNLLIAKTGASDEDLIRVIQNAHLSDLVNQLPQGIDTWLGERGVKLSGGELQRVMIARALLRDAPVLILDEPTANLDAETERNLLETIIEASKGRSLIYITHRLVGLEDMDEILVMDKGQIIERGSHSELISSAGMFSKWWAIHNLSI